MPNIGCFAAKPKLRPLMMACIDVKSQTLPVNQEFYLVRQVLRITFYHKQEGILNMGWKYRALSLVTASLFLVTLILTPLTGATGSAIPWNVQTVDIYATGGYVAVDSNNTPHIAYAHRDSNFNSPWKLAYASWNGLGWDIQNITSNYSALGLVLDEKNYPHILCVSADLSSGLAYASWTGTNWTIQTIDKNGITGTLALDSAGNPHVAYLANGYGFGNPLNYATSNGSGWSIHTVTVEGRDQANSIDDILGYPHIA